jgi:hypothetical protein
MPNHVHALIGFQNTGKPINKIVGDGKRFIAYEIIKRLETQNELVLLGRLSAAVESTDKERGKKHEVWEDSFDWKEWRSHFYINQKLDYMHLNPCNGKWNLATSPINYLQSSARFYACGEQGIYILTNVNELDDVDLTKRMAGS